MKEFRIVLDRPVEPSEYGDYEYLSSIDYEWHSIKKGKGDSFYEGYSYHKIEPALDTEAPTFESAVDAVLKDIKDMLMEKNQKYGNSALEPVRIFSKSDADEQIRVRIDDKLSRIRNGADNEDPVKDLMGYLVLLKIKEGE
jgi:hypothetical protein